MPIHPLLPAAIPITSPTWSCRAGRSILANWLQSPVRPTTLFFLFYFLLSFESSASTELIPFALPSGVKATPVALQQEERTSPLSFSLPRSDGPRGTRPHRLQVHGERQRFVLSMKGSKANLKRLSEAVARDHWSTLSAPPEESSLVARKFQPYGERWLVARADKQHVVVDLVERSVDPNDLKPPKDSDFDLVGRNLIVPLGLAPPLPDQTQVDNMDDFPFLSHFPGMELQVGQTSRSETAMEIQERVEGRGYRQIALRPPITTKVYYQPFPVQPIRLFNAYDRALRAVGWRTVDMDPGDISGWPYLIANFSRNGRNVWMKLEFDSVAMRVSVSEGLPIPR